MLVSRVWPKRLIILQRPMVCKILHYTTQCIMGSIEYIELWASLKVANSLITTLFGEIGSNFPNIKLVKVQFRAFQVWTNVYYITAVHRLSSIVGKYFQSDLSIFLSRCGWTQHHVTKRAWHLNTFWLAEPNRLVNSLHCDWSPRTRLISVLYHSTHLRTC